MTKDIDQATKALKEAHTDCLLAVGRWDILADAVDAFDRTHPLTFKKDPARTALMARLAAAGNQLEEAREAHAKAVQDCADAWSAQNAD